MAAKTITYTFDELSTEARMTAIEGRARELKAFDDTLEEPIGCLDWYVAARQHLSDHADTERFTKYGTLFKGE